MQKLFVVGDRWVRFSGEFSSTSPMDPAPESDYFYTHGENADWSNRGQPLGAWYGSGGDNQTLAVDVLTRGGRFGGYLERVRRNDAYFWNHIAFPDHTTEHDAEVGLGLRQVIFAGPLEVNWDAYGGWRENRDFIDREPVVRLSLGVAVPLGKR